MMMTTVVMMIETVGVEDYATQSSDDSIYQRNALHLLSSDRCKHLFTSQITLFTKIWNRYFFMYKKVQLRVRYCTLKCANHIL